MLSVGAAVVLYLVAVAIVTFTVLPLTGSQAWWVQGMDFPRIHYIAVLVPLIGLLLWLQPVGGVIVAGVLALCLVYHGWRVLPYTPLVKREIVFVPDAAVTGRVSAMASNVLMENDRFADLGAVIDRADPDILFLMETDDRWVSAMEPWLSRYPHVLRHPLGNHYGLVLATRLKVRDMRVRYLTRDDTPTAFAELESEGGRTFRFVGMHPRPPTPGVDTVERDAQLAYAARFARDTDMPVVVMGDFNAVAWSDVSQSFKAVGRYLDPRIGRGPIPSFDANHWIMRFPIDQLYVTQDVAVAGFARGAAFGSDHYPMIADLIFDADLAARHNQPMPPTSPMREAEIKKMVERHAEDLDRIHGAQKALRD